MNTNRRPRTSQVAVKRLVLLNRYYRITRFYDFIRDTSVKGGIVIAVFVAILVGLEYFVLDFDVLLNQLVETYSPAVVFSTFFASETVLGLLPPEIFIAWASKADTPWLFLAVLASLSYLGGVVAYLAGNRLFLIPSVKDHIEMKIARHIVNLRKWGGLFVFIGAMLPLPHSIVSLACGLIKYSFRSYLLWALFRFVRFVIYAVILFQIF
ncbi:YqaA family protein [Mangrovibacterium marinum]|uniref:Membrane protein YqaA with SNARE-associated domain n=1 Tax=Mangrovibacterium marinum TaxID=1639118 RepID=A0A2T5C439_9BACT|nr:VTT domain-containing protein [Mangrovibacterium marinum]PTN09569.1 membrane protein YqaA with SNARE-associated domain [Mangrovibacterium marinum]